MESLSGESYENLKELYKRKGEYKKAIKYSKKILKWKKANFGKVHAKVADEYQSIGNLYSEAGKHDNAVQYSLKAIQIKEIVSGKNDTELGDGIMGSHIFMRNYKIMQKQQNMLKKHTISMCWPYVPCMTGILMRWFI